MNVVDAFLLVTAAAEFLAYLPTMLLMWSMMTLFA